MHRKLFALAFAALLGLAGCIDTDLERGLAGAAAGALLADAVGGNAFTGALIGGAAGATCDDLGAKACQ
jgi:osmotically inducible lipoprotein OsmB